MGQMLSKCANPECAKSFQYFRDGKLFQVRLDGGEALQPPGPPQVSQKKQASIERFWLCGDCSRSMTLVYQRGKGTITVPLHAARSANAS